VCTNGITDMPTRRHRQRARSGASGGSTRRLVDLAMEAGGDDDATALVAEFKVSS
jgi:serine/threonine protein phosphatase PrpC